MTTIKKVLCAIDLTKASRNAFDRALSSLGRAKPGSTSFMWCPRTIRFHGTRANGSNC